MNEQQREQQREQQQDQQQASANEQEQEQDQEQDQQQAAVIHDRAVSIGSVMCLLVSVAAAAVMIIESMN